ncbi:HEPN domain-containing protein [Methanoplanus endosymbiosus]|uniref:HEPN domain-containing protein n=1 Tax=Methanoplanus endosymbiosus TaxID=33865 RepID=A0A9E7TMG9_9EURY|nr:HEPN domain-containing protein [Methanoplanus endosymbiosus]UUX93241.1 HEPN domain-containing protein [Methanoplanus endosymbiosus]
MVDYSGYYSQFHSLKALVFSEGYREKSHSCLLYAVEALFVDTGRIDYSVVENFSDAMRMREDADYGCFYNAESAESVVNTAGECTLGSK